MRGPQNRSKYMRHAQAQIPLRITPQDIRAATRHIEKIDANSGYQARQKYKAAGRWVAAIENEEYVWLSVAGAATPVGLGGYIADAIARGLVDVVVTTGANVYHDLHFACGLPVRHGSHHVDDNDLRKHKVTRIYTQFIDNDLTLKAQDYINQIYARKILPRLKQPFSTATLVNEFGKEMLADNSGKIIDKKGSFVLRAAEYGVPVFLDSGSNHSLGMDLSLLALEGFRVDTSPTRDVLEAAALSIHTQPQLNVFWGEGGPRNFTQTTAPTASEILAIPFEGSAGCIRFTTADERTGGLSGSGESEAVSWGKYTHAGTEMEIVVWGEYTLTVPDVLLYVAGQVSRKPRRLMDQLDGVYEEFVRTIKQHEPNRLAMQKKLKRVLPSIIAAEKKARVKAGYKFD